MNISADSLDIERFFDFRLSPGPINIILPEQPRSRPSIKYANYPPFDFEVAPDDVKSAMSIHSLLARTYGRKLINIRFCSDFIQGDWGSVENMNRVLIGGPPTNRLSCDAMRKTKIYFVDNHGNRINEPLIKADRADERRIAIGNGKTKLRKIGISQDGKEYINKDYCLISKRITGHQNAAAEFVIAGLRAHGQLGSCIFLEEKKFYEESKEVHDYFEFQVLVKVVPDRVRGKTPRDWRIVDKAVRAAPSVFIAYVHDDKREVASLASVLRRQSVRVKYDQDIPATRPWERWIEDHIKECDFCVVCFSEHYINKRRSYLNKELELIRQEGENRCPGKPFMIPVMLSEFVSPKVREEITVLNKYQDTKLFGRYRQPALNQLVSEIQKNFGEANTWRFL